MSYRPPHIPAARRIDGDRVTELIPAREWLSRKDKNNLSHNNRGQFPPSLPRYASRDHLHDRNRELCVFDPANPGLQAYVHVTRRRNPNPEVEAKIHRDRAERIAVQFEIEKAEAVAANELLELRSQSIRKLLANRSKDWRSPQPVPRDTRPATVPGSDAYNANRAQTLEQKLKEFRDSYSYVGYSAQPPGASTAASPYASKVRLRGGWPVQESFGGVGSPSKHVLEA